MNNDSLKHDPISINDERERVIRIINNLESFYSRLDIKDMKIFDSELLNQVWEAAAEEDNKVAQNKLDGLLETLINSPQVNIEYKQPINGVNFHFCEKSDTHMVNWLLFDGTADSAERKRQQFINYLQQLDEDGRAITKVVGMICTCDKKDLIQ